MITQPTIGRLGVAQNVAVTTASAASTPFGPQTRRVLLVATAACNIAIGDAPTASASSTLLPANFPFVVTVNPGEQVAAITAATATLSVTELT
jgi:hypothetical protein